MSSAENSKEYWSYCCYFIALRRQNISMNEGVDGWREEGRNVCIYGCTYRQPTVCTCCKATEMLHSGYYVKQCICSRNVLHNHNWWFTLLKYDF